MKAFILKTILIISIISTLLSIMSLIADAGLKKTRKDGFEINEIYEGKINADMLISGNSRAWVHISPFILDSALNVNSYNLGADGLDFLMQISRYNLYSEKNKPIKYIIQCVDDASLCKVTHLINLPAYIPYLNDTVVVSDIIRQYKGFNWWDYYNPFTKYALKKEMILGFEEIFGKHQISTKYKGYEGQNKKWDGSFDIMKEKNPDGFENNYAPELFISFENYIKKITNQNIKIVMVFTPQYIEGQNLIINRKEAVNFFQNISEKYNIPYLDYSSDSLCLKKEYFYNSQHLNKTGSEIFTLKLAEDIENMDLLK